MKNTEGVVDGNNYWANVEQDTGVFPANRILVRLGPPPSPPLINVHK